MPNGCPGAHSGLDVDAIRRDVPILERRVGEHPLIYLDSAATSQKPNQVYVYNTRAEVDALIAARAHVQSIFR